MVRKFSLVILVLVGALFFNISNGFCGKDKPTGPINILAIKTILTTGAGDGSASVIVTPFGSFGHASYGGSADYDPIGDIGRSLTVYQSAVYFSPFGFLHSGGIYGPSLSDIDFTSTSDTEAVSEFDVSDFHFRLTQKIEFLYDANTDEVTGSLLTQTYEVTNNTGPDQEFTMIRHVDGDLYFVGGFTNDYGGVAEGTEGTILYEFDTGDDPENPTTFVGITAAGGHAAGYRIAAYPFTDNILNSGKAVLTNTVDGDNNGDRVTDGTYDITLSLGRDFTLSAGALATFQTKTRFGAGAIGSTDTVSLDRPLSIVQVLDTGNQRLVAGKNTVVRAYLSASGVATKKLKGELVVDEGTASEKTVAAKYTGVNPDGTLKDYFTAHESGYFDDWATNTDTDHIKKTEKLVLGENTMNFYSLDDDALNSGLHSFKLRVTDVDTGNAVQITGESAALNNINFQDATEIEIIYVAVAITDPDNPLMPPTSPDFTLLEPGLNHMRTVYPVNEEDVTWVAGGNITYTYDGNINTNQEYLDLMQQVQEAGEDEYNEALADGRQPIIAGMLPGDACISLGSPCNVGGYTYSSMSGAVTTIQKQRFANRFVLDIVLSHEMGHTDPFFLDDEYVSYGASTGVGGTYENNRPADNPLTGTHTGGTSLVVLEDNTKTFYELGVQSGMFAVDSGDSAYEITSISGNSLSCFNPFGWDNGDSYSINHKADNHSIYVKHNDGAFNLHYTNNGVQLFRSVFYSQDEAFYGFMGNAGLGRENVTWVEPQEYTVLFREFTEAAASSSVMARVASRKVVKIKGTISSNGDVTLKPLKYVTNDVPIPSSAGTQYAAVLYDATGMELDRTSFDVSFTMQTSEGEMTIDPAPFSVMMEYPAEANEVRIVRLAQNGTSSIMADLTLYSRIRPPTIPQVQLLYPTGGENLNGATAVIWTGSHATESLTYSLFFSNDDGNNYVLIATDLTSTTFEVDFSTLAGGNACRIKVVAGDGFNAESDVSGSFVVGNKAPLVIINSPADGFTLLTGTIITLSGSTTDFEDGPLSGASIVWTSSIDGALGSGATISPALSLGTHTITMTATDSQGASNSTSNTLTIGDTNSIPIAKAGPDITVNSGDTVTLDGSDSYDPNLDQLTYSWEQVSGPSVTLSDSTSSQPQFTAPQVTTDTVLQFTLVVNDGTANSSPDTVNVTVRPGNVTTIALNVGWNLISLCLQPSDTAIGSVLDSIAGKFTSVWAYKNREWEVYDPQFPGFSNLSTMEAGWGYWIDMNEAATLIISGSAPSRSIALIVNWNLVGYNSCSSQSIGNALASIEGKYVSVWAFMNGEWKVYDPQFPGFSNLTTMDPGYGYWINTTEACTWTLPLD